MTRARILYLTQASDLGRADPHVLQTVESLDRGRIEPTAGSLIRREPWAGAMVRAIDSVYRDLLGRPSAATMSFKRPPRALSLRRAIRRGESIAPAIVGDGRTAHNCQNVVPVV